MLGGQSSFASFPPANRPVGRSKFFPAVARPKKIYKQKLMENADAKLQAPQYAFRLCELKLKASNYAGSWVLYTHLVESP